MPTYTHGGDVYAARQVYGAPVLDFSANLNPLGMPPQVRAAAMEAVDEAVHYPDPLCRALRAGIARRDGVAPEQVVCGGGGADLIFRLCCALRPRRALVTAPTFSEYEQALAAVGCEVVRHPLEERENFAFTPAFLSPIGPGLELCFLCSPNNPTGQTIPLPLLRSAAEACRDVGAVLVVDQCFLELSDGEEGGRLSGWLEEFPNLVLLRAFTKSFAIPGLRLGYCLTGDRALAERLYACGQPWPVSGPAQAAGLAALACPDWPVCARDLIQTERPLLADGLAALGLKVYPSRANYLLFRAPGDETLKERLLARGVLIRSCANYPGLGPGYYRVAVRTRRENQVLLSELKEVL